MISSNYFNCVFSVQYNRQSPSSDMSSYTHKVELNDFRGAWTALNRKITVELFEAYENMEVRFGVFKEIILLGRSNLNIVKTFFSQQTIAAN